jgi:hypothetical protein
MELFQTMIGMQLFSPFHVRPKPEPFAAEQQQQAHYNTPYSFDTLFNHQLDLKVLGWEHDDHVDTNHHSVVTPMVVRNAC